MPPPSCPRHVIFRDSMVIDIIARSDDAPLQAWKLDSASASKRDLLIDGQLIDGHYNRYTCFVAFCVMERGSTDNLTSQECRWYDSEV